MPVSWADGPADRHLHMLDATNQSDRNRRAADRSHPQRTGGGPQFSAATSILTGISLHRFGPPRLPGTLRNLGRWQLSMFGWHVAASRPVRLVICAKGSAPLGTPATPSEPSAALVSTMLDTCGGLTRRSARPAFGWSGDSTPGQRARRGLRRRPRRGTGPGTSGRSRGRP